MQMKWLEEMNQRYLELRAKIKTQDEFDRLSPLEKSYYIDMDRLLAEVRALNDRHEDFVFTFRYLPDHELIKKVSSGKLKPEDKAVYENKEVSNAG